MTRNDRSELAEYTAMMRAQHYLHDERPLILEDPYALRLLSPQLAEHARKTRLQGDIGLRVGALILGRSRYAEDCFEIALNEGVRQYVSFGSGA